VPTFDTILTKEGIIFSDFPVFRFSSLRRLCVQTTRAYGILL